MVVSDGDALLADTMMSLSQTDASGRYRLEGLPPGRYLVMAGPLDSPIYHPGVRGRASAQAVLVASGATLNAVDVIVRPIPQVTVRGRVDGTAPPSMFEVWLRRIDGDASRVAIRANVRPDRTFEFSAVQSGYYSVQLSLASNASSIAGWAADAEQMRIEVGDGPVEGITIAAPPLLTGRVEMEPGSTLSVPAGRLFVPDAPSLLRLVSRRVPARALQERAFSVRADGQFIVFLSPGAYMLDVATLPIGYDVQAISFGDINLLTETLHVPARLTGSEPPVIVRLKKSQGSGVKVSGRILKLPPAVAQPHVVVLTTTAPSWGREHVQQRVGEAAVSFDGGFEFSNVPWGSYTLSLAQASRDVIVTDRDITGLEMTVPDRETALDRLDRLRSGGVQRLFDPPLIDTPLRSPTLPEIPSPR
jgi:hypothetical protein